MPVWCHFFEVYLDVDSTFASISNKHKHPFENEDLLYYGSVSGAWIQVKPKEELDSFPIISELLKRWIYFLWNWA